jgi:2-polyprenyl-3-methyl-5-hydroxy-6-metoxy-1,4-benzoquinol methylase
VKFIPNAILPPNLAQATVLNEAASQLEKQLSSLDYKALKLSDYGNRYYAYDLRKLTYMLQSYVFMLLWAQYKTGKKWNELTLLDHGGGIGMLSLLAKLAGVKTVIHQDLNPIISKDAKLISNALNIPIDYFVTGDTIDFVQFVNDNQLNLNIVGSRNVIEHVYDLNQFFKEASKIKSDKLLLFLSTTANEKNPLVNVYTKKLQRNFELKGNPVAWGEKKLDPTNSGLNQRKRIIEEAFPSLNSNEITRLSKATRGKIKEDVLQEVKNYLKTGIFPVELKHPTNTCSPVSGSWVEHLLPLDAYKKYSEAHGFHFDYLNGFYNTHYPQTYLNWITPMLNVGIKQLGKKSSFLAPFISIIAEK